MLVVVFVVVEGLEVVLCFLEGRVPSSRPERGGRWVKRRVNAQGVSSSRARLRFEGLGALVLLDVGVFLTGRDLAALVGGRL